MWVEKTTCLSVTMWGTILDKQSGTILKMRETNIIKRSELKYTLKNKTFFQIDCIRILLLSLKYPANTWRIIFTSIHFQSHLISCLPPVSLSPTSLVCCQLMGVKGLLKELPGDNMEDQSLWCLTLEFSAGYFESRPTLTPACWSYSAHSGTRRCPTRPITSPPPAGSNFS